MKRNPLDEGKRWLAQAERDLDDAAYSARGERYNLACFLAQQSAEKALKAFLFSQGAEAVWGHSLAELCQDALELNPDFGALTPIAVPLDKYYIPTRYPNGLPGGIPADVYTESDARLALSMAEQVIKFVAGWLTSKPST